MSPARLNTFRSLSQLNVAGTTYDIYRLDALEKRSIGHVPELPFSLKVLLENLLRQEDGRFVHPEDIEALSEWKPNDAARKEISFMPARVLLQDFTGVPSVVDLAAMREAMRTMGGDPKKINPLLPAELVIDHSVQVDKFATADSFSVNALMEFQRNVERYAFLRWGQQAFHNFKVVPPDTGICHQVNLEYLACVVYDALADGRKVAYPDSLVGTDSHTTMVNFTWRVRLGRRRNRSRGRDARPAAFDADSGCGRLQIARAAARGLDGNGSRARRYADAAHEGRCRKVCGVLRHGPF